MGLALKALLGAAAVVLIDVISRTRNYYIAALVPLFPLFSLAAYWIIGSRRGVPELCTAIRFGMCALLPYLGFLLALHWLASRWRVGWALIAATLLWSVFAAVLVVLWNRS